MARSAPDRSTAGALRTRLNGAALPGDGPSSGVRADAAREAFRQQMDAKGHAVNNARAAVAGLEAAFTAGSLNRTPVLDAMLADLAVALEQDDGQKLGGKSAEAARFILRAISRELANA